MKRARHDVESRLADWEKQTKVRLAVAINQIIEDLHLSQGIAARRVKINQPKISPLSNYRLEGFSVERLMNFLTALDRDVDIVIRCKSKSGKDGPDSGNSRVASSSCER